MEENKINNPDKSFEDILKGKYAAKELPVSEELWEKLNKELEIKNIYSHTPVVKIKSSKWLMWAAAALLPFIVAYVSWFSIFSGKKQTTAIVQNYQAPKISNLKNESALPTTGIKDSLPSIIKRKEIPIEVKREATFHLKTIVENKDYHLPDSSHVFLNYHSDLTYISERKVKLDGEAFFEVRHNPKVIFEVFTKNAKVTVLGTSFLVNNSSGNGTSVTVYTGLVALTSIKKSQKILIKPGQTGSVNPDGSTELKSDLDSNLLSWKDNRLSFSDTPLLQVADILERHFHTKIHVSGQQLEKCTFTGTFVNPDLAKILKIIGATFSLKYELNNGTYQLSGNGCR